MKSTSIYHRQSFLTIFLQIVAMAGLGIGQPLLQLIQDNPEFLVVHESGRWDVIILSLTLFLFLPFLLAIVSYLVSLVNSRIGLFLQTIILGGLFALILAPVIDKFSPSGGWANLILIGIGAGLLVFSFWRFNFLKHNLAYLAFAAPVFLVLFFGAGSIRRILLPEEQSFPAAGQAVDIPVVMIVFDEFPLSSLLNQDFELDCQLYPNFCRLARQSTWYPNATTISGATLRSVPTIMSGKLPLWHETPTLADHPKNIFTLLGASHQVSSLETQTRLCPDALKSEPVPGLAQRLPLLFEDLGILYQHIVVPEQWAVNLVPVSNKWGEFNEQGHQENGRQEKETRIEEFDNFVESIKVGNKPNLVFAHILLPHNPYNFFPNGKVYNWPHKVPANPDGTWGDDKLLMAHSYRRHLLQVVATDKLLGNLLDRLEELGIYEDCALIITADHGTSFRTGLDRRRFNVGNEADIMCVPLFIKYPGQMAGKIDNRMAQTVDIMPTLVSALANQPGWDFDGANLLAESFPERKKLDFIDPDTREERKVSSKIIDDQLVVIQWKNELFGEDGGYERLFGMGDVGGLVGKDISALDSANHNLFRGRILDAQQLENVDLNSNFIPAEFNGTLDGHKGSQPLTLALAVNGEIAGVSETYPFDPLENALNWQITTSMDVFREGANKTELFLVQNPSAGTGLVRIPLFTPSFMGENLGGVRVSGIEEEGLFPSHDWGGQQARWTDGRSQWDIPVKPDERPRMLTVKIVSSGPLGANLSINVNGVTLLSQVLPEGKWEARLPLQSVEIGNKVTVVLESSVFIPAEINPKSSDQRELGLAVTTLIVK